MTTRMKITDFLEGYSIEVTAKDALQVGTGIALPDSAHDIFVPFLPGEDADKRVEACAKLGTAGLNAIPHISARRLTSADELDDYLSKVTGAGVDRVLLIAGDPPKPMGPYADTLAIIKSGLLEKHGIRTVGIAGHPEGHPDVSSELLWQFLQDKTSELAMRGIGCEIVTQFSFDAEAMLGWLAELRRRGIDAPAAIGVPGPASVKTLLKYAARCGVGASSKVVTKYGFSLSKLFGSAGPERFLDTLVNGLADNGLGQVRAHIYPFGGFADTANWLKDKLDVPAEAAE